MDFSEDEKAVIAGFAETCPCQTGFTGGAAALLFPDSSSLQIEKKQQNLFWISGTPQLIQMLKDTINLTVIRTRENCVASHCPINKILDLIDEIRVKTVKSTSIELEEYWKEISSLKKTEQETLIHSRKGQDKLRKFLLARFQGCCVVTGINTPCLLIASHIKPWRDCCQNKEECLDPENILLLAKNYDAFFDAGLISFSPEDGSLILSNSIPAETYAKMGIDKNARIPQPSPRQKEYLIYHNQHMIK